MGDERRTLFNRTVKMPDGEQTACVAVRLVHSSHFSGRRESNANIRMIL